MAAADKALHDVLALGPGNAKARGSLEMLLLRQRDKKGP